MDKVQFSVVIPVYNGEAYIGATIESVLAQTYPHFNLFILENGSTDRTMDIISSFTDPRITVVPAPTHLSIEDNWARIRTLDLQEYMTVLCHDDLLYLDFLETIAALIQIHPDASLYHGRFHSVNGDSVPYLTSRIKSYCEPGDEYLNNLHLGREDIVGSGYVLRSKDYKEVGGIPPFHKLLFADIFLFYLLAQKSYKVCSPKIIYAWRRHDSNVTKKASTADLIKALDQYYLALRDVGAFNNAINLENFYQYARGSLVDYFRRDTEAMIFGGESRDLKGYEARLQQIFADTQHKPFLEFYKLTFKIQRQIVHIRFRSLRVFTFYLLKRAWLRIKC